MTRVERESNGGGEKGKEAGRKRKTPSTGGLVVRWSCAAAFSLVDRDEGVLQPKFGRVTCRRSACVLEMLQVRVMAKVEGRCASRTWRGFDSGSSGF